MTMREEIMQMLESAKCLPVPIAETTNLYFDLGMDSLSFIGFLLKVEERYGISFDITEMEDCLQVGYLVRLAESKVKGERGGNHD